MHRRLGRFAQPSPSVAVDAGDYLDVLRNFGHGGSTADEIAGKPEGLRHLANANEVAALGLKLEPAPGPPRGGAAPRLADPGITATKGGGCTTVGRGTSPEEAASESSGVEFLLPTGSAWLGLSAPAGAGIYLGRFDQANVPLGPPAAARGLELRIPADRASLPWRLQVRSRSPITVCGLGPSASAGG